MGRIGETVFRLIDTAGIDDRFGNERTIIRNEVEHKMLQQTMEAARAADVVFLMFDAKVGPTVDLIETARALRKISGKRVAPTSKKDDGIKEDSDGPNSSTQSGRNTTRTKRIVLLANKLEGDRWLHDDSLVSDFLHEASRLGFGEAVPISAEHGEGMADLAVIIDEVTNEMMDEIGIQHELETDDAAKPNKPLQLAIVGRQNVGKSTLVNALLESDRVITGDKPGLTRDAISIQWTWQGHDIQLVDTAGIRKASQRDHSDSIEESAVADALRALKLADVVVVVLDAGTRELQRQELAIAGAVVAEGRSIVFAANKMDLLIDADFTKDDFAKQVKEHVEERLPMLRKSPVVPMSSLYGDNVETLMPIVLDAYERWRRQVPTGILNRWLREVIWSHPPPLTSGRATKIKYITQTKGRPPSFLLFCNVDSLPDSYMRFLTRNLQDSFGFFGMETRLAVKRTKNPFEKEKKRGGSGLGGRDGRQKRRIAGLKRNKSAQQKRKS